MTNLCLIILLLLHTVPATLSKKTARTSPNRNLQNSISNSKDNNHNNYRIRNVRHQQQQFQQQPKEEQKILSSIFDDLSHDIHLELNKTRTGGWNSNAENVRRKRLQIHLTGENGLKSPLAEMLAAQQQAEKAAAAEQQANEAERTSSAKATEPDVKALEAASEQVVLLEQPADHGDDQRPIAEALTDDDEMGVAETQMHEMVKSSSGLTIPEEEEFRSSSDVFEDSEVANTHISEMRRLPKSNPGLGITHIAHGELGAYHYKILEANQPPVPVPVHEPGPIPGPGPSPYDKYTTPAPHVSSLAPNYHPYPVTPAPGGYFSTYGPHINGPPHNPYDPYGPPPVHHDPYGPPPLHHDPYGPAPLHHDPYGPPPQVPHHGPYHPPPLVTSPKPVFIGTYGMCF